MKKILIIALGVGVVGSIGPSLAQAQGFSLGIETGPRHYDDRPGWREPPRAYRDERERSYVYRERSDRECWTERRIIETPYGRERRRVRVCE